jgi:hypothetical protein
MVNELYSPRARGKRRMIVGSLGHKNRLASTFGRIVRCMNCTRLAWLMIRGTSVLEGLNSSCLWMIELADSEINEHSLATSVKSNG